MAAKPTVTIIGAGRLGTALILELARVGYRIPEVICRSPRSLRRSARSAARIAHARLATIKTARFEADVVWLCVPDREIASVARSLAGRLDWTGKIVFHSSGALTSDELSELCKSGAAVASVHPLMTFVTGSVPPLRGVPFGVEGDSRAVRQARHIVRDLGGMSFPIDKRHKSAYHAWGTFLSPLLVAAFVAAEQSARAAGIPVHKARQYMRPIVEQTLRNYGKPGPARAFSGPLVRGEAAVIRQHLVALRKIPVARKVYIALAQAALSYLPVRKRNTLRALLRR